MERTPTELLTHIFSFACVDDGTTARSLTLSSRYFAAIAEPYKLQSAAVSGFSEIERFIRLVELEQARTGRVPTKHILISDRVEAHAHECYRFPPRQGGGTFTGQEGFLYQCALESNSRDALRFSKLLYQLLALLASTLETLTCLIFNPCSIDVSQTILRLAYPIMTTLSLRLSAWPGGAVQLPLPPKVDMPKLQSVHLASAAELMDTYPIAAMLLAWCPALSRLRFSDVHLAMGSRMQLIQFLGVDASDIAGALGGLLPALTLHGAPLADGRISVYATMCRLAEPRLATVSFCRQAKPKEGQPTMNMAHAEGRLSYSGWMAEWLTGSEWDVTNV